MPKFQCSCFDKAHERGINKDIKATIVRPSKEFILKSYYVLFPVRAQVCTNLKNQVNTSRPSLSCLDIIDSSPHGKNMNTMFPA